MLHAAHHLHQAVERAAQSVRSDGELQHQLGIATCTKEARHSSVYLRLTFPAQPMAAADHSQERVSSLAPQPCAPPEAREPHPEPSMPLLCAGTALGWQSASRRQHPPPSRSFPSSRFPPQFGLMERWVGLGVERGRDGVHLRYRCKHARSCCLIAAGVYVRVPCQPRRRRGGGGICGRDSPPPRLPWTGHWPGTHGAGAQRAGRSLIGHQLLSTSGGARHNMRRNLSCAPTDMIAICPVYSLCYLHDGRGS